MKRFFISLISLLSICSLFATQYKSNVLMQKLSDSVDSEYVLFVEDNEELLYKNEELIKKRITSVSESFDFTEKIITVENLLNESTEKYLYRNGLLVEYDYYSSIDSYSIINSYDDSILVFTSISDSNSTDVVFYIRDLNSGKLLGSKTVNSYNWNENNYLVDNDLILTEIASGLYLENDFSLNEDQTISYIKNGVEYIYSLNGFLLEELAEDSVIRYQYVDGIISETEYISGNVKIITNYRFGKILSSFKYVDNLIIESSDYSTGSLIKTLYSNEVPIAEVIYDENNIKVIDIRYLN